MFCFRSDSMWTKSKRFGFVPIISFDIGTFVLPFWYRWHYYSSYIRKPFLIYDFATAPLWISLYMRKIFFSFLSVWQVFSWEGGTVFTTDESVQIDWQLPSPFHSTIYVPSTITSKVVVYDPSEKADQCSGSMKFLCGSGSVDSYLWLMDPNPDAVPYPAILVSYLTSTYYFLKVYLHHFSKIKSHKEVTKQWNQCFSYYFCLLIEGSWFGSGFVSLTNGSGSGRPKHMDPTDPDPKHWQIHSYFSSNRFSCVVF